MQNSFLREFFFNPSMKEFDAFLREARTIITPFLQDSLGKQSLAFLSEVLDKRNIHYKVYCMLLLLRSFREFREMVIENERPEVAKPFFIYLDHELKLFLTGFRPPATLDETEQETLSYVKDDPDQFKHHCVEYFVYRVGRFYRTL